MVKRSLALVVIVLLLGGIAQAQAGPNTVTDIQIEGNEFIPAEDILEVIEIEIGDEVDGSILRDNMERIYEMGWFYDIYVDYEPYEGGLRLIFQVMENFEIKGIKFDGVSVYTDEEIKDELKLELNYVLNTKQLNEDLRRLEQKFQEDGYILARITDVQLSEEEQVLFVSINQGYLNEIRVEGNEKTRDYVIEREFVIEEGEVFNAQKAQQTLQNIYNLGFFSENISSSLDPVDPEENLFDLVIELEEVDTGNLGAGGGYNTRDGFYGFIDVQERNLLGRGQEVGIRAEIGRNRTYEIYFSEPKLMETPYSISVNLRRRVEHDTQEMTVDDEEVELGIREIRQGGSLTLGRQFTEILRLSGTVRIDHSKITYEDDILDPKTTQLRALSFTARRDTTDVPFSRRLSPTEGGIEIGTIEFAGYLLGGDFDFTKVTGEVRRFYPGYEPDHNWALRLKAGTMFGPDLSNIPRNEKLMVGGSETLRGYDFRYFEGHRMILFNAEYRFPIYGIFEGAGFIDTGYAWSEEQNFKLNDMGLGIGAGVRLDTPLGKLRLDIGYRPDIGKFKPHFSIGQTF